MELKSIKKWIVECCQNLDLAIIEDEIKLEHPVDGKFGDLSTNIAMATAKQAKTNPLELAKKIKEELEKNIEPIDFIEKIEIAGAGFINFYFKKGFLISEAEKINYEIEFKNNLAEFWKGKKIMVEFAHPNTHKELHIGHMRTLVTGESLSRIFEMVGTEVFRANYQGDIGPHVAKSIWGTQKILEENKETFEDWNKKDNASKAHLLGMGYVKGCAEYENNKEEIDNINKKLYAKDETILPIYWQTRQWSLDYYNDFYERFGTRFNKLFFESEIAENAKKILLENKKIFEESEEAIIFDGEKYGLHKRVFLTALKTPTYECKELGLAFEERKNFEFDKKIHVVANEQAGYFKVVFKAIELIDPWFENKQFHLSMGMVTLVGKKISSRTGEIVTVDSLLDEVKKMIEPLIKKENLSKEEIEEILEAVTMAAVKFSILKSDPTLNSVFDIKQSISLDGDSGPYLQYTYARCMSVLKKTNIKEQKNIENIPEEINEEEMALIKEFYKFEEKIKEAAERYSPAVIAEYLLGIARKYNEFYAKNRILEQKEETFRIFLTKTTSNVLKTGLHLLGIDVVEKM